MAFLKVVKGSCPGQILVLAGGRMVLGRHPNCEIVLDNAAVSRHHAQILESHGSYYLEDMSSRNRTYLNGDAIEGRTELHPDDEIKVCDVLLKFHLQMPPADGQSSSSESSVIPRPKVDSDHPVDVSQLPERMQRIGVGDEGEDVEDGSSIISTMNATAASSLRLGVKPEAKLRAVLEISKVLGNVLKMDDVLQKTLDGLFKIFPQADEGFILLKDVEKNKLFVKATKSRQARDDESVRISMTIVRQAMKTGDAVLSADAASDKRFQTSESLKNLRIRSMMCVPLVGKDDETFGVIQLDTMDLKQQFSLSDLDMLVSVASQVSLAVENATLHEELLKQRDTDRDLEFATQVQLGFLPSQHPKIKNYEFFDYYEAALRVGGDYFDYIPLPDGRIVVALGDVAGKGVPAALLMARLYSSARFHLLTQKTVAAALTGLNAEIASSGLGHRFITFVVAIVDPHKHEVTIANAGHLPPLLRLANGEVSSIAQNESGMPLGVVPDQKFREVTISFSPGDTIALYTDGITEAMNPQNDIYGRERLAEYMSTGPVDVERLVEGIIDDVEKFCEGRSQRDDMCLVCLRRSG